MTMNEPKTAQETWFHKLSDAIEHSQIMAKHLIVTHSLAFKQFQTYLNTTRNRRGTIWLIGNGGSAATCTHIAQDIMNRLSVRTETLSAGPMLTCLSNDYSFEECFLQPLQTYARAGDILIAISCSGESKNILNAANYVRSKGIHLITLSAMKNNNSLNTLEADLGFWVPTDSFGIAEVAHHAILHNYVETLADSERKDSPTNQHSRSQTDNESSLGNMEWLREPVDID